MSRDPSGMASPSGYLLVGAPLTRPPPCSSLPAPARSTQLLASRKAGGQEKRAHGSPLWGLLVYLPIPPGPPQARGSAPRFSALIAPVRPTHFCLPNPVPSPGPTPLGTRWAGGDTHTQAPLSASLKPKSRTHFVRTELISPGRNTGVERGGTRLQGTGGTRQGRPDLAPGSPPQPPTLGFLEQPPVECSDPGAPVRGASMCQAAGSPGLPRHSGAPWTLRLQGDSFPEASGSQFGAERILCTPSHVQV